ncbi:phage antirepressor KilAC domain-containing protein [Anaerotignum sp.]|uniref:phage antirepressor KilAC domain-containing protein n=1 Tax=Anaerotignum sp. TaxID=2039241 RepID=UPI002715470F|nr:phage antirepressor KilAC domain-containing protein [Anaerotignum sp.]
MNQLIKVNCNSDRPTVLGRDLHEFLGVKERYNDWFPRMVEYGFAENVDFTSFTQISVKPQGGRPSQDHQLTIEMAKEISMLQRNEKGKQARQYFIQLEKDWNSPEKVMARALQIADHKIHSLTAQIEQDKPKVIFADAVSTAKSDILIGELAKLLKQNGIEIGEKRLFEWLRDKGYLIKRKGTDWNSPTQKSMEMSLFKTKETTVCHSDGHTSINKTTKVTGKGQVYFINLFLNRGDSL